MNNHQSHSFTLRGKHFLLPLLLPATLLASYTVSAEALMPGFSSEQAGETDYSLLPGSAPPEGSLFYYATIKWDAPQVRENGDTLDLYEISGYEVMYRNTSNDFTVLYIPENGSGSQKIIVQVDIDRALDVSIASYDLNGLQSEFQTLTVEDLKPLVTNAP